jgi:hypothetical protein
MWYSVHVLQEYVKSVFWKRRSLVISGPPVAMKVLVYAWQWLQPLPADIRQVKFWQPRWWLWCLSVLLGIAIAQFLAWREEWLKVKQLEAALQKERTTLEGCPWVILTYIRNALVPDGLWVRIGSNNVDAFSVQLERLESANYYLTSQTIPQIRSGVPVPLVLRIEPKILGHGSRVLQQFCASKLFFVDKYADESGLGHEVSLAARLAYTDASGKKFTAESTLIWDRRSESFSAVHFERVARA